MAADAPRPRPVRARHPRAGVREQRSGKAATLDGAIIARADFGFALADTAPRVLVFANVNGRGWYALTYTGQSAAVRFSTQPPLPDVFSASKRPAAPSQPRDPEPAAESDA